MSKASISAENKSLLASVVSKLKANPTCAITLTGYPRADKRNQALAGRKLDMLKAYLIEQQGISADRITTNLIIDGGDEQTIDIK
jgi:outer membrane protein OmpA-like peptidoglycan-associated protein